MACATPVGVGTRIITDGKDAPPTLASTGSCTEMSSAGRNDLAPLRVEGEALHPVAFGLELRRCNPTVSIPSHAQAGCSPAGVWGPHLREHRQGCATPARSLSHVNGPRRTPYC